MFECLFVYLEPTSVRSITNLRGSPDDERKKRVKKRDASRLGAAATCRMSHFIACLAATSALVSAAPIV